MDTGLGHRGRAVLQETNDVDLGGDLAKLQDQVDLSVDLVKGVAAVLVPASKLGSVATVSVDAKFPLVLAGESCQMKKTATL